MNFSFWENKNWFSDIDFAIIGSGIVGLHTALRLRRLYPASKIVIFEKGMLPQGASTKNAGFACFGSLSEIDRKSTRLNSSHVRISYAVFCLKKKNKKKHYN